MGCYGCGSPNGEQFKLCPECIAKRKNERALTKSEALKVARGETKADPINQVFSSGLAQVFGLFLLLIVVFGLLMLKGPLTAHGPMANFLFAGMVANFVVAMFIWWIFLARMLVNDFMWALASFIVPALTCRYIFVRWDDPVIRKYFFIQVASIIIAGFLGYRLAVNLNVPVIKIYNLYSLYRSGFNPKLDKNGDITRGDDTDESNQGNSSMISSYESE